ncbi:Saposin-like_type B domin-containing protein [Hexamita inflata]|uniref:Saposin-like type B domin-containing protein n=1 Tax=Hexamita inflata TaxID=28002 RepID=A0AA86QVG2_9EUKA|nr:Saposin-like type B domin-containing protein [Hexamita inflata]
MLFLLTSAIQEQMPAQKINFLCDVCTIIVQGVEEMIVDPQNVQEVKNFLNEYCAMIPFDFFQWCEQIVDKYYDELIQYIQQGLPPVVACQKINLCD